MVITENEDRLHLHLINVLITNLKKKVNLGVEHACKKLFPAGVKLDVIQDNKRDD
jgi:hypothetical protein